jgi:curli biogenesis system outer membrane secretion channel CsgG
VGREGFKVVERTQVEKVLKEQEFAWSGVVDQATAARLGKLLGVEYVIFGSLTGVEKGFTINARLVKVETGEVLLAPQASSTGSEESIRRACGFLADELAGYQGW